MNVAGLAAGHAGLKEDVLRELGEEAVAAVEIRMAIDGDHVRRVVVGDAHTVGHAVHRAVFDAADGRVVAADAGGAVADYRGWMLFRPSEVPGLPKSIRDNPGSYRSIVGR